MDGMGHDTCGIFEVHTPDPNVKFRNVGSPTHSREAVAKALFTAI